MITVIEAFLYWFCIEADNIIIMLYWQARQTARNCKMTHDFFSQMIVVLYPILGHSGILVYTYFTSGCQVYAAALVAQYCVYQY